MLRSLCNLPGQELHRHAAETCQADAPPLWRVTYEMMRRRFGRRATGASRLDGAFRSNIDAAKEYVVSGTMTGRLESGVVRGI